MKIQDHIISVFLKSMTDNSLAEGIKLKVNKFSVLHFYAMCSGNDQAWRPRIKAALLPVHKNTISFPSTKSVLYCYAGFCLKNNG